MLKSVFPPQRALVTITFEGEAIQVEEGTTVAAAVLDRAGGETRTTARKHDGRGPYCHMGVCYECLMEIDGVPNQQSCLIPVREGMSVKRQSGAPSFRTEENK
ncbi:(2Fe-2S)-binding protein [Bilophila wadsworthia]|uniref:(2Fe-2S)-binding protein n=1 Tax=Bilophila wadsworthia TaxID=35833 RepID=UPI002A82111E|nr:(2Fe-2S)-binding protein [Bilophila wadsworthia]MDY3682907.1 (2Fe-2S)-binding protein [Bilophila wadsworthia]